MTSNLFSMPQMGGSSAGNQNQPYQLGFYDLKLQSIMIYNPSLVPSVKKPSEEEIQDAKLIYYYPSQTPIQEKRNHVGLAEGNFQFWNSFFNGIDEDNNEDKLDLLQNNNSNQSQSNQPIDLLSEEKTIGEEQKNQSEQNQNKQEQDQQPQENQKKPFVKGKNVQITIFDKYIHAQEEVEENIWLYIVFAKFEGCDILLEQHSEEKSYNIEQTGQFIDHRITESHIKNILRHFYETFWMFFSEMNFHINQDKRAFINLMDQYILRYLDLNGDELNKSLNVLRYQFQGFQYAPIEKNIFLTLQSLINILSTIDSRIKHYSIYFSGYFIYSTLNHDKAFSLYEYLYSLDKPFIYSDRKVQCKFAFLQEIAHNEELFYGNLFNSNRLGIQKQQNAHQQGVAQNISGQYIQQANNTSGKSKEIVNLQNIFLRGNNGETEKYQMNLYYERQLMILMLYDSNQEVQKDKLIEMNTAISRNCEKIAKHVEKAIQEQLKKEESYKYLYFNHMNIATKISNPHNLNQFLQQEIDTISNVYNQLQNDNLNHSSVQQLCKSSNVWIYGYKNVSRVVIMIFPGNLSLPKVYEESEKLFKNYFPLLYM
ncbi:hypothetical protein ABPG74_008578 [Tetrahymena malaccensis]